MFSVILDIFILTVFNEVDINMSLFSMITIDNRFDRVEVYIDVEQDT